MTRWLLALLLLALPGTAIAQNRAPGEANWTVARFTSLPASVSVDVVELGGAQLVNDVAATNFQLDATNTDVWGIDLATLPGYPANCEARTYVIRFQPTGVSCQSSPGSCAQEVIDVGGHTCKGNPALRVSYTTTSTAVSDQGITQAVITYFNKRGQNPIRWRKLEHAANLDFSSPDQTEWEVYFYSTSLGVAHLTCTVLTTTDPAVSLPSSAGCSGN